jgi:hypothetical protein
MAKFRSRRASPQAITMRQDLDRRRVRNRCYWAVALVALPR